MVRYGDPWFVIAKIEHQTPSVEISIHSINLYYDAFYVGDRTGGVDMILGYTILCQRTCAFVSFPPISHFLLVTVSIRVML